MNKANSSPDTNEEKDPIGTKKDKDTQVSDEQRRAMGQTLRKIQAAINQKVQFNTVKQYAKSLNTYTHLLNEMEEGKRAIPLKLMINLQKIYNVNLNYLVTAGQSGAMFLDDEREMMAETVNLNREIAYLKNELKDKEKIIMLMEQRELSDSIPLKRKNVV